MQMLGFCTLGFFLRLGDKFFDYFKLPVRTNKSFVHILVYFQYIILFDLVGEDCKVRETYETSNFESHITHSNDGQLSPPVILNQAWRELR